MIFSQEQLKDYNATGYTVCPQFFDQREVAALQAELERFKAEGLLHNVSTDGDGKTHSKSAANLQVIPLFDKSDLFRALPFHPKVVAAITELLGEPAKLHLDQIFLKPAQHGKGTSWHQDNFYFKVKDPMKGIGMWIAVHEATAANGTMHMIPNCWQEELEHTRDPYSDHHSRCYPDESQAEAVEIPAGGALFFCYGVPHCTRENTTDKERAGLALHFLHVDYIPDDIDRVGKHPRPLINGPDYTGGEAEYGVRVAGTWEAEVDRVLSGVRTAT